MNTQKYRTKRGRARLSRNRWNIELLLAPSSSSSSSILGDNLVHAAPYGDLELRKTKKTKYITSEYKEQFSLHQIRKTYYGDLNKFQILNPSIESRLDVLVYRTGVPVSIFEARNWIRHNKVFVNDKIITSVWAQIPYGTTIKILAGVDKKNAPSASHLLIKKLPELNSISALYLKPIVHNEIRYPKGATIYKVK